MVAKVFLVYVAKVFLVYEPFENILLEIIKNPKALDVWRCFKNAGWWLTVLSPIGSKTYIFVRLQWQLEKILGKILDKKCLNAVLFVSEESCDF